MDTGNAIFHNLFVLELANNHLGSVARGLKIIRDHGSVVRQNGVRAAIKLQFRQTPTFIHSSFSNSDDIRYIKKTRETALPPEAFATFVHEIRALGCLPMATPFDEPSVELCQTLDLPLIKIASSDSNDWPLLEAIASTRKPVIASSGGTSEADLDNLVTYFLNRGIPLAINHCVSLYPTEDADLELDQIDYLRNRYPETVVGFSTHEYTSWDTSMHISYAKGARTWERHVDIDDGGASVSPYCSLPHQIDEWFRAFHAAVAMCGTASSQRRVISQKETAYLDALVRGLYARHDLAEGYEFSAATLARDFYSAIPLQKGQLSVRELINGRCLTRPISSDEPLTIDHIDGPYSEDASLRDLIMRRGL